MDQSFKIQPVAAFYRILARSFLFILSISVLMSAFLFGILKTVMTGILGKGGQAELLKLINSQTAGSIDYVKQTQEMQKFMNSYPSVMPVFFVTLCLGLLLTVYLTCIVHQWIRYKLLETELRWKVILLPGKYFFKVTLFMLFISGMLILLSGLIFVLMSTNPLIGALALILLCMVLLRHVLVIPGIILADMELAEAVSYSREQISTGKAFKILVFGGLLFFALSFLLSLIFYFPLLWFDTSTVKIYLNFLMSLMQIGIVSVGMASLFFRYAEFEEVKIAE